MTRTSKFFAALVSASLISAPVAAQERAASPVAETESIATDAGWFVLIFALAVGFTLLTMADDDDAPASP